ncbi:MAG: hypothetical protein ABSE16_11465 [Verrucomicrobiota bacterium]
MNVIQKSIRLICSIATFVFSFVAWASYAQDISSEAGGDFKWFNGLGFPDVKDCPYVRIATGRLNEWADEPENQYINGFLLMTNGPRFRVLTLDLADETFTNAIDGTNEYKRVGFGRLDLQQAADSVIQSLRNLPAKDDESAAFEEIKARFGKPLTVQAENFVLGWACWRHGLEAQAEQLYEQAQKLPVRRQADETTNSFRVSIEKNLAYTMMWHAVVCFGAPSISRPQLLAMFNSIVTNYPDSEYHERAVQTAEMLRKMIAKDEAHAKIAITNLDQLPVEQRVQELIFRLRDQNGHQWSQPGFCDIFRNDLRRNNTNTPAHQLVRLGYAAVPQLITALDDPTLTRSVGYWRDFTFSHTVLTVGDCAADILQRITGKSFFVPTSTFSYMSKDQKAAETRKAAEAWWAEFQQKGEKQMLIEAVSSPTEDAPAQADMLCRRYPDAAVQTLERGIQATTNDWIRPQLVQRFAFIEDPRVVAFLNNEMTDSPVLKSRVGATSQLQRLRKGDPTAAMIQEWQELKARSFNSGDAEERVLEFLVNADSPAAIRGLGSGIRQSPVATRLDVVEAVGGQSYWFYTGSTNSPATWAAIEELLVHELEDTETEMGFSGSINGKDYDDLRVCDMAGRLLAEHWTNRYAFDLSASLKVRDRQCIQCINIWRQAHALPLLPPPREPSVHVKPAEATIVTDIKWENGGVKPSDEFARTIAALKNKPLDASQIVSLLAHYATTPEPQTAGLQFTAIKDEDLTGVRLLIRLLPGRQLTNSEYYRVNEWVTLGRRSLFRSGGAVVSDYFGTTDGSSGLPDAVNQALAGKPETPFEIAVQIRSGNSP